MTTFKPNMDLTTIFKIYKTLDIPEHIGFYAKSTFHKNDMHVFKQVFKEPSQFKDTSESTIYNTKIIDQTNKFKSPSNFHYKGSKEITDALDLPNLEMKDFNAQYRYRYPQLTTEEYIIQQMQTEAGTPNELNTYMRQEGQGKFIEDISKEDGVYEQGLLTLKNQIKQRSEEIKKEHKNIKADTNLTDAEKRDCIA